MTHLTRLRALARRRPSRIGVRLFAFNLLVLFVPIAGIVYLDVYEGRLLETQERGMVQQARVAAAALGATGALDDTQAIAFLRALGDHGEARIKIFGADGRLMADSARFGPAAPPRPSQQYSEMADPRRRVLYRVGAIFVRLRAWLTDAPRRWFGNARTQPTSSVDAGAVPAEVRAALAGRRYAAASRPTPGQRSLTLSSAVPVRHGDQILGAVVVSQSTYRILQALYDVRLRLFEIVLLSMAVAAVLTGVASSTIVNPIVRLRRTAGALATGRGELAGEFGRVNRKDEIGDLARSLEELAARLDAHIKLLESVAADVAHEFKNPLTAIRTAAETISESTSDEERRRFHRMLLRDVDRLEGLVSGVRELAHIDAEVAADRRGSVDLTALLRTIVEGRQLVSPTPIELTAPAKSIRVAGSRERLTQVFLNLIENAASFSPSDAPISVHAELRHPNAVVIVADRGPGIPPAHVEQVFDRFFSYRPGTDRREHMGLGLAIAKAVVTGYGGAIAARNRPGGGAQFEVTLPLTIY